MTMQQWAGAGTRRADALDLYSDLMAQRATRAGPVSISALPAVVNLSLYQGDDFTLLLNVSTPTGEPADLSQMTVESHIRPDPAGVLAGEFEPAVDGPVISLHLPGAVSSGLPLRCVWDAQITDQDDAVTTLAAGTITLTPEVTRPNGASARGRR